MSNPFAYDQAYRAAKAGQIFSPPGGGYGPDTSGAMAGFYAGQAARQQEQHQNFVKAVSPPPVASAPTLYPAIAAGGYTGASSVGGGYVGGYVGGGAYTASRQGGVLFHLSGLLLGSPFMYPLAFAAAGATTSGVLLLARPSVERLRPADTPTAMIVLAVVVGYIALRLAVMGDMCLGRVRPYRWLRGTLRVTLAAAAGVLAYLGLHPGLHPGLHAEPVRDPAFLQAAMTNPYLLGSGAASVLLFEIARRRKALRRRWYAAMSVKAPGTSVKA